MPCVPPGPAHLTDACVFAELRRVSTGCVDVQPQPLPFPLDSTSTGPAISNKRWSSFAPPFCAASQCLSTGSGVDRPPSSPLLRCLAMLKHGKRR
eukprot:202726-Chlamydomonas_euryale.AAC.6